MAVADVYYAAAWGPILLWVANVETDNSRSLVIHEPSRGDTPVVQDRGLATRVSRMMLLFEHDMPGEDKSPIRRFREFKEMVDAGEARLFTHPIDGSYRARVRDFRYTIDSETQTARAEVEFIPDEEVRPVSPTGPLTSGVAGEGAVTAAADAVDAAFAAVELETDITDQARAVVEGWSAAGDELGVRQVLADVADLSARYGAEINRLRLEHDLALFEAYRTMIMLGEATRVAGIAATSETSSTFTLRIDRRISLLALMAQIYGGANASDAARQALNLNDIRTPGWLEIGQILVLPQTGAQPRAS